MPHTLIKEEMSFCLYHYRGNHNFIIIKRKKSTLILKQSIINSPDTAWLYQLLWFNFNRMCFHAFSTTHLHWENCLHFVSMSVTRWVHTSKFNFFTCTASNGFLWFSSQLHCYILAIILTGPTIESKDSNNQWQSLFFFYFFQFKLAPSVEE